MNCNSTLLSAALAAALGLGTVGAANADMGGFGVNQGSIAVNSYGECWKSGSFGGGKTDAKGCPITDSDGDGVNDDADRCPGTPAGVKVDANGCPFDDDKDGVINEADKCPGTPYGIAVNADGCTRDDDGDGVAWSLDKCKGTPKGDPVDANGCTALSIGAVNFGFNSADLTAAGKDTVSKAASTLGANANITKVVVSGYTDSTGPAAYNQALSERRANSVKKALVSHGMKADMIEAVGHGESNPVASNDTREGRAQNRRVEINVQH
ncbi:MAG: OmpA family protein [Chromatiales bacterium]|nr:OmpA family protein [Gammaproteobacteria bacterium]MCP5352364.1 OmpA family protein [Chromatiales bacterium]